MKTHHVVFTIAVLLIGYYAGVTYPSLSSKLRSYF